MEIPAEETGCLGLVLRWFTIGAMIVTALVILL
jgi:hypothetical protein